MVYSSANTPIEFSSSYLKNVHINRSAVETAARYYSTFKKLDEFHELSWAIKALQLTDLTTLAGDDTPSNVRRLCIRAAYPFTANELKSIDENLREKIHTAAVCVYPSRVKDAFEVISSMAAQDKVQIAAVATGFPSGQYSLNTRIDEIKYAIASGATEIDIVVDRSFVLRGQWKQLYDEIVEMRLICGSNVHMKTILGIGECGTFENVYKASMVAMMAGSDFIKTSTGKETVNATLPIGIVMIRAIQMFFNLTQRKIGFKPAGGVRTLKDAINWMTMIQSTLGNEWLQSHLFRFGASGLLDDIEKMVRSTLQESAN